MAAVIQLLCLRQGVQQQLVELDDPEKASPNTGAERLSGDTERPELTPADDNKEDATPGQDARYATIPGITKETTDDGSTLFLVGWAPKDALMPRNWSLGRRLKNLAVIDMIAFVVTAASSIDSAVTMEAAMHFGVSEVTESLAGTGMFLIGFGIGALLCSPLSELVGRYPVYLGALVVFGIWEMASALSPNIGAQIIFRFLAGAFASTPLTVAGGSMSDIWDAKEKTWGFPLFAIIGFGGPILGPVIGAYIGYTGVLSWRWADWIMLIADGLVIFLVLAFKDETLSPRLLKYRAHYFRTLTGDARFKSQLEASENITGILKTSFSRPFVLSIEPIVLFLTFYMTIVYIVLFTFLDGYTNIFHEVYGVNSGLTYTIFVAMFLGVASSGTLVPIVYRQTVRQLARDGDDGTGAKLNRESRLLFAMFGAPLVPVGLFWMAWTDYSHISIWSPIVASAVVGFGIISVFLSSYMYIIDAYETYAASALTFVALVRYLAAGGMTVVGVPMYKNLGTHYTLTILACISAAAVPIPYALFKWGPKIRAKSKYATDT